MERKSSVAPEVPRRQPVAQRSSSATAQNIDQGHRVSRDPDQAMVDAQVQVGKLEAAIATLGEDDVAASGLKEALERARSQAHARLLHRIQWTQDFVSRATKRVEGMREEVARAQAQLRHEEALLHDGESRLVALKEEASREAQPNPVEPPPTVPAQFAFRVDIFARVCSRVAPRVRRSQSRVGSRRSGGESTQEDEDIGNPFSGFDDHRPGSAYVGAAQRSPELIRSMESAINCADATVKANASRLAP